MGIQIIYFSSYSGSLRLQWHPIATCRYLPRDGLYQGIFYRYPPLLFIYKFAFLNDFKHAGEKRGCSSCCHWCTHPIRCVLKLNFVLVISSTLGKKSAVQKAKSRIVLDVFIICYTQKLGAMGRGADFERQALKVIFYIHEMKCILTTWL